MHEYYLPFALVNGKYKIAIAVNSVYIIICLAIIIQVL